VILRSRENSDARHTLPCFSKNQDFYNVAMFTFILYYIKHVIFNDFLFKK